MNNTRSAQTLRRRIALFLLISTITFVASPFYVRQAISDTDISRRARCEPKQRCGPLAKLM